MSGSFSSDVADGTHPSIFQPRQRISCLSYFLAPGRYRDYLFFIRLLATPIVEIPEEQTIPHTPIVIFPTTRFINVNDPFELILVLPAPNNHR